MSKVLDMNIDVLRSDIDAIILEMEAAEIDGGELEA